ncbi:MAG: hypothetical protein MMC33_010309 [Icmadophila ericetorum]|nr:hypothetical protein [Icmadophila ericetorum]
MAAPSTLSLPMCCSRICDQPGTMVCKGCWTTIYCSPPCQRQHWKIHKRNCFFTQEFNGFIIRAKAKSGPMLLLPQEKDKIADQVEPMYLDQTFGISEALKGRLGWKRPYVIGKFFDHRGSDDWFYTCYAESTSTLFSNPYVSTPPTASIPGNTIASLICDILAPGDVAVVRVAPFNERVRLEFTKNELCKTLEWYVGKKAKDVRLERERSWAMKIGAPLPLDEEEDRIWMGVGVGIGVGELERREY